MQTDNINNGNLKEAEVIDLISQISDQEKHFNGLETQYRLLASTWLLASLGATGYIMKDDNSISLNPDKLLLIGAIGFLGSIGILLLWVLDIKVYHKLLNSVFMQGVLLEFKYSWLPKIRTEMLLSQEKGDVIGTTGFFYVISAAMLQCISLLAFVKYFGVSTIGIAVLFLGIGIIIYIIYYMQREQENPRTKALTRKLREEYKSPLDKFIIDK